MKTLEEYISSIEPKLDIKQCNSRFYYFKLAVRNYHFSYDVVYLNHDEIITDIEKIKWFRYINFAGTDQTKNHINKLKKYLQ